MSIDIEEIAHYATAVTVIIGFLTLLYNRFVRPLNKIVEAAADLVQHQLAPNSGSSLTDKVDKLHKDVPAIKIEVAEVKSAVLRIESMVKDVVSERTNINPG